MGKAGYYSFDFPYRCISDNEAIKITVYYEGYSSLQSFNAGNNFFSSLISNTKV